jgi:hypothetical protein
VFEGAQVVMLLDEWRGWVAVALGGGAAARGGTDVPDATWHGAGSPVTDAALDLPERHNGAGKSPGRPVPRTGPVSRRVAGAPVVPESYGPTSADKRVSALTR